MGHLLSSTPTGASARPPRHSARHSHGRPPARGAPRHRHVGPGDAPPRLGPDLGRHPARPPGLRARPRDRPPRGPPAASAGPARAHPRSRLPDRPPGAPRPRAGPAGLGPVAGARRRSASRSAGQRSHPTHHEAGGARAPPGWHRPDRPRRPSPPAIPSPGPTARADPTTARSGASTPAPSPWWSKAAPPPSGGACLRACCDGGPAGSSWVRETGTIGVALTCAGSVGRGIRPAGRRDTGRRRPSRPACARSRR